MELLISNPVPTWSAGNGASRSGWKKPRRGHAPAFHLLLALLLGMGVGGVAGAQSGGPSEYQVKAAFLYNFAKFVEWPAEAFPNPTAPMHLCVLGENPFGSDLAQIVEGKTIGAHPVQALAVADWPQARACHILFISASEGVQIRQIVEGLRGANVLTVADTKGFLARGGMINFVLEDGRVRFEVNLRATDSAGLKISAKLLSLAKLVVQRG